MAVPTFVSITPAYGPSGGHNIVAIAGTNFRVPTDPEESVTVTFDGINALRADVISTTELQVKVPHNHKKGKAAQVENFEAINIVITNIDSAGDPIVGETVTASKAYTYRRSPLRLPRATEEQQVYRQIINEVIWSFQRQITPNVAIGTSVDFGESGKAIVAEAKLPSVILVGPRIEEDMENRHRWEDYEEIVTEGDPNKFSQFRNHYVGAFEFDVMLESNRRRELYAMNQALIRMCLRNPYLKVPITPSAPNDGYYKFPFVLTNPPSTSVQAPNSDLIMSGAILEVRWIPMRRDEEDEFLYNINEGEMNVYQGIDLTGTDFEEIPFADS